MALKDRISARIERVRARRPWVDHLVRMQEHYGRVGASQQAGAATYFAFLSFFPIMALAFFVVGRVAQVYPEARHALHQAINDVLPGLIGGGDGQISMAQLEGAANALGIFGLVGVLYAGLGWLSSLQSALLIVFETPAQERPNFVIGKVRDLAALVVLGIVMLIAVAATGFVRGFSSDVLDWMGVSAELGWLLTLLTIVVGLAANALLFFAMFTLLARPDLRQRSLWRGALLGAVGFEALKQLSGLLLGAIQGQPAFQVFGIALILLVWINYFSRLTLYAAAYAVTAEPPPTVIAPPVQGPSSPPAEFLPALARTATPSPVRSFAAGAATMAALAGMFAILRRKK
ncbi:YihY/virulence factor BrkB family protein [Nocardioides sp. Iso805N]|uniref:YihY/virulence factor BrkB family protein n=1 Tax=Nocardioides sp. Iso805N TaxID=1283287 RepID=UPI000370B56B|nr:YhjD/YihY/BrkB family envelope integrity protein [Nocardioides sp. Iso805N]